MWVEITPTVCEKWSYKCRFGGAKPRLDQGVLTTPHCIEHNNHMKRTNLVLPESLLEEALRLGGERTYSATVRKALEDFVRRIKARQILELGGSGLWGGDLGEMRGDRRPEEAPERAAR